MKKLLLVFGALVLVLGGFAGEKDEVEESIQCRPGMTEAKPKGCFADEFDELVYDLQATAPKGVYVRPAKEHRIIFYNLAFDIGQYPGAELADAKRQLAAEWKKSPPIPDLIKRNNIRLFVNYVNTERMICTIIITPEDL